MANFYQDEYKATLKVLLGALDITSRIQEYQEIWEGSCAEQFRLGEAPSREVSITLNTEGLTPAQLEGTFNISFTVGEEVYPVGLFYLLDLQTSYEKISHLKLYDAMAFFDAPYNSALDYEAGTTTVAQVQEMCTTIGITADLSNVREKPVKWYDNTVSMRSYISWIAELSGCNAVIDRAGVLQFVRVAEVVSATIPLDKMWEYEVKETFTIGKIMFNDGLVEYVEGDDSASTLYLNSKNGYIDDISDVQYLNFLLGKSVAYVSNMRGLGNPTLNFGQTAALYDYVEDTTVNLLLSHITLDYSYGVFQNTLKSVAQTKAYEQVANYIGDVAIKRLQVDVDYNTQSLTITSQKVDETSSQLGQLKLDYDNFTISYKEGLVSEDGMKTYVGSQLETTSRDLTIAFEKYTNDAKEEIMDGEGGLNEYKDYVATYTRFDINGIELGKEGNDYKMNIDNAGLAVNYKGSAIATFGADQETAQSKMFITKAEITQSLQIGNFAFIPETVNNSMSLKKIK